MTQDRPARPDKAAEPLWTPSETFIATTAMHAFRREAERRHGISLPDYESLWRWSVDHPGPFWDLIWSFCGVIGDRGAGPAVRDGDKMPGAKWFPGARLNYAENLLRRPRDRDDEAMVFWGETRVKHHYSFDTIYDLVSRCAQALRAEGVAPGDRVVGYMPNLPETIIAMLATASIGAVWSSASPDFGIEAVLDRFGQVEPTVLFAADGYYYDGKHFDCMDRIAAIVEGLPSLKKTVVYCYTKDDPPIERITGAVEWRAFISAYQSEDIRFERVPFDHPLFIMFSSGTTGAPKCIVHGHGGVILQHLKEHALHCDIRPQDRVFYFTTCGWMMWNWLASVLAQEATLLLYDGSPFHGGSEILWRFADKESCTLFGTSAKYIESCAKAGLVPKDFAKLKRLRTITSTGSPLKPESFDYVHEAIGKHIQLASISGGTDILSCFMLASPLKPVYRGELQAAGLGLSVEVWNEAGEKVVGEPGELVCTKAFPAMPTGFWNDPDGSAYRDAYFTRFPGVWTHGDWVEETATGGFVIYGRSDATLNPGGVRIGTAEIYRQVEACDEILEALAVGQDWDGDQRVILFVRMRDGADLDDALRNAVKARVREHCSPRHVPAKIIAVADLPRTKSGKLTELAVRDVIHDRPVANRASLANPEALDLFAGLSDLKD